MTKKNMQFSVVSFFYIALVLHSLQRMSGLFIIELSKGSKSITYQDAAIPFIYSWAVAKVVSSFSNFLVDSKSSKIVVFCGALLCIMGTALCILDTDITTLTVFWGFIFGSGYGLASPHLAKDIACKNMRAMSFFKEIPSSLGISVMPFLLEIIILQYGLQGSFIIFSGIIMQCMPFVLAAAYNIEIRIPNIKWRVRKKSNHYFVSKQEAAKAVSIESFNNSLEPDFVIKVTECNNDYHHTANNDSPVNISKETSRIGRKRSDTRGNDLQGLELGRKILTFYQTVPEMKICEENEKMVEENFSNMLVIDAEIKVEKFNKHSVLNSERTHCICKLDETSPNPKDSKNESLVTIEHNKVETEDQEKELEGGYLGNNMTNDRKNLSSASLLITDNKEDVDRHKITESPEIEQRISLTSKQKENTSLRSHKLHHEKSLEKKTPIISPHSLQIAPIFTIPLDIKVHVEEYTFSVDKNYRSNSLDSNYSGDSIQIEKYYSQGKFLEKNEYIDSSRQTAPQNVPKDFNGKDNLSNMHSASDKSKLDGKKNFKNSNNIMRLNISKDELKLKFMKTFKFFNKIISPACLCIVIISIIFEISLITVLMNIGDFVNVTGPSCWNFTWILVAFGVGGLFGKVCCFKISETISEKSHTVGVVLFLLTGLSIAGVLYSPNLSWLAGFYSILGALEGGFSSTLPKFIVDYTHEEVHHVISSMKNFLSGVTIICLPSLLCLLPDEMDDYEFLLQTLSCLSVLCALFAYFLPYLRSISKKRTISTF